MLNQFRKIFNTSENPKNSEDITEKETKLKLATCIILLEAVTADSILSETEFQKIIELLKSKFSMTHSSVNELIETSKKERENSTDLWHFTNLINGSLSIYEKHELMEMIWEAIYSDGTLDKFENYLAHKLRNLLHIDHSKFIELKLKAKNKMNPTYKT